MGGGSTLELGTETAGQWSAVMLHVACHAADLCRWWLGEAQTISADISLPGANLPAKTSGGRRLEQPAIANLIVTHERSQATCHLSQSRSQLPGESYQIACGPISYELVLAAGERSSTASGQRLRVTRPGERMEERTAESSGRAHRMLTHFVRCLRGEEEPAVTAEDAQKAQEIAHAAILSASESVKISLPLRGGRRTRLALTS